MTTSLFLENRMYKTWVGIFFVVVSAPNARGVRTTPQNLERRPMTALDCRSPQSVQTGLVSQVCDSESQAEVETDEQEVLILYSSSKHAVHAVRCEKYLSRIYMVCGSFSHSKILSPPDIMEPETFDPAICKSTMERRVYTKEDGGSLAVEVDRAYTYKFVAHGSLQLATNNVYCSGSSIMLHGERHDDIVELVTAQIKFVSVDIELDIASARDLESRVQLPTTCARDVTCSDGPFAYVVAHPAKQCNLYILRSLPMKQTTVRTSKGDETALVSHQHKIFLILKDREVTQKDCRPVYECQMTNFHDLKVVREEDAMSQIAALSDHLAASQVDIDLELRTASEYMSYRFERMLANQLRHVAGNLCKISQHTWGDAELSPFHQHALLRIKGELLQELTCKEVRAEVRLGEARSDRCYPDAIPAWLDNQPVLIAARTRLVMNHEEAQTVKCDAMYSPVFKTDDGALVQAAPVVKVVDVTLTHFQSDYLHLGEEGVIHETFGNDILYTTQEIDKFNNLLHFGRSRNLVLDSLVRKYCTGGNCGSYTPGTGSAFSLDALKDRIEEPIHWFEDILKSLEEYGGICSIIVLCLTVLTLVYRIGQTLYLALCRKVRPMHAFRLSFMLNDTIRSTMINEPEPEATPMVVTSPKAAPASTVTPEPAYASMRMQPPTRIEELSTVENIPLVGMGSRDQGNLVVPYRPLTGARQPLWA